MKNTPYKFALITVLSALILGVIFAQAQTKTTVPKPREYDGKTYLSGGKISGGYIKKVHFDSLIVLPLVVIDSVGKKYKPINFTITYAERGLFEDSTGKPRIMTDHYSIAASGGAIPEHWIKSLLHRTKHGDTATISNVEFQFGDSIKAPIFYAEPIKLVIIER